MATVNANPYNVMGFISRTVASNNLTVAIKDQAGNNFSSTNPMVHKIGAAPRSLTGVLSVTVNAGTNSFNAGSAELKTKEIDYFVYLGWRASNTSMFVLISRIPYARTYADFSSTATAETYGAYSGAAPASTDEVVVVGRFNATNSGSASYNWSVPATSIVFNHPIFETRWLTYTSTLGGFSGTPTQTARYRLVGNSLLLFLDISGTSNATSFTATSPLNMPSFSNIYIGGFRAVDNGAPITATVPACVLTASANTITFYKDWGATGWTNSGTKGAQITTSYEI